MLFKTLLSFGVLSAILLSAEEIDQTPSPTFGGTLLVEEQLYCADAVKAICTYGRTKYLENAEPVRVLSSDKESVSVVLKQSWDATSIENYFYAYRGGAFDTKCFGVTNVEDSTINDRITIQYNEIVPSAPLIISLQETSGFFLGPGDSGTTQSAAMLNRRISDILVYPSDKLRNILLDGASPPSLIMVTCKDRRMLH